jgi:ribosome-binding factor A
MAREFSRTDRVGAQMQRELAALVREELESNELGMITIQEVRVVRDFSHAKVYFTKLGGRLDEKGAAKLLNQAVPMLRHALGQRMRLRTIPLLHFLYDVSVEQGARLSSLIDSAVESDTRHHEPEE